MGRRAMTITKSTDGKGRSSVPTTVGITRTWEPNSQVEYQGKPSGSVRAWSALERANCKKHAHATSAELHAHSPSPPPPQA
eukprot:806206-Prymnesium_polylepis.1